MDKKDSQPIRDTVSIVLRGPDGKVKDARLIGPEQEVKGEPEK
jgi:hypothetical protein